MVRFRIPGWLLALLVLQLSCFVELLNAGSGGRLVENSERGKKGRKSCDCRRTRQAVSGCGGSV